jgi:hypothetical protein
MCLAPHVPEILRLGVSSLKIEGRMKSPEYVYGVTEIYRRLIDEDRAADKGEMRRLEAYFSRSGFSDAYFTGADHSNMVGVRTDEDKAKSAAAEVKVGGIRENVKVAFPLRELPETAGGAVVFPRENERAGKGKELILSFNSAKQLKDSGIKADPRQRVVLPVEEFLKSEGADGAVLPAVFFEREAEAVRELADDALKRGARLLVAESLGGIAVARAANAPFICGMRCSTANSLTAELYRRLGAETSVISPELNVAAARDINRAQRSVAYAYGRLPLMTLTRCTIKPRVGCDKCGYDKCTPRIRLKDRMGVSFPVFAAFGHRNVIYNSVPTYIGGGEAESSGLSRFWLSFTEEDGAFCADTVRRFVLGRELEIAVRRAGMRKPAKEVSNNGKSVRSRHGQFQHPHLREGKRHKGKRALGGGGR